MKTTLLVSASILIAIWLKPLSPAIFITEAPLVITEASTPIPTATPTPSDSQVIAEIIHVFKDEDRHTIKKMIDIAYGESGLRWNAHNKNTNGSEDFGVFQINSVHTKRFGSEFKTDYKANIQVAYALFQRQGFNPWVIAHKLGYVK